MPSSAPAIVAVAVAACSLARSLVVGEEPAGQRPGALPAPHGPASPPLQACLIFLHNPVIIRDAKTALPGPQDSDANGAASSRKPSFHSYPTQANAILSPSIGLPLPWTDTRAAGPLLQDPRALLTAHKGALCLSCAQHGVTAALPG